MPAPSSDERPEPTRQPLCLFVLIACVATFQPVFAVGAFAQDDAEILPEVRVQMGPTLRFERLGIKDGLAQKTIYKITQDDQGFLWLATQGGLHRYDGHDFKVYAASPFDTTSLLSNTITSVSVARDGMVWAGTSAGLIRLDPENGRTVHFAHDPSDSAGLSNHFLNDVLVARNGDVWVAVSDGGLHRMRAGQENVFDLYGHDPNDPSSMSSDDVQYLSEDAEGFIWCGSANGMNRIDPEIGEVTRFLYDSTDVRPSTPPRSAFYAFSPPDEPDIVWIATSNGLVRLNERTGEHERIMVTRDDDGYNPLNRLYQIVPDPADKDILWAVGSTVGLIRFDTRAGSFTTYRHDPQDPHSLSENYAQTVFADRSGTMWVGTVNEGLNVFNPKSVDFVHLQHDPEDLKTIAPGAVFDMLIDRSGALWFSTEAGMDDSYLTRRDPQTGTVTRFQHDSRDPNTLYQGPIYTLAEDAAGRLWAGHNAYGNLLSRIDPATGRVTRFGREPAWENAQNDFIRALLASTSDPNIIWIGSMEGLNRLDTRTGTLTSVELGIEGPSYIRALHEDARGTLWVGTNRGLLRLRDGQARIVISHDRRDTTSLSSNEILHIMERMDEPGVLWISTLTGLNRYDARSGVVTHYMVEDGLPNNTVYGVLEDAHGSLWMSTNNGISNFDPEKETFRNYGLDDGLIALEYNQAAFARDDQGTLYFGSTQGVTAFSPENLSKNDVPPPVALVDFKLFNQSVPVGPGSLLQRRLSETERITLAHDQNEITFDFVALHFGNSERNRYAYRMEGFDEEWVQAGSRRSATYTNLPPGDYTFRVIAANPDGVWNTQGASVGLRLNPAWWDTWWAYALYALLFIGGVVSTGRLQQRRLSRAEGERTRVREVQLMAEAQRRRREDAERLSEIGKAITSTLSIREVIDIVYEHVNALMDAAVFGIGIHNADRERLEFPVMKERGEVLPPFVHDLSDDSRPGVWCFKNQKEFVVGDYAAEYDQYLPARKDPVQGEEPVSILYLPLIHQHKAVGVITTQSFERNAYTDYHVSVLRTLAAYAAIALDNAESYRQLNGTLNELKSAQEQLVQQEKLASLGSLTAGIAHEIKNPLNFINNFSSLSAELVGELSDALREGRQDEVEALLQDLHLNMEKIEEHGRRADGIVRSMMAHARGGEGTRERVALNALVGEFADLAYHGQRARRPGFVVELVRDLDEKVGEVEVVPQEIGRVVLNLVSNAIDALAERASSDAAGDGGDGGFSPVVRVATQRSGDHVEVRIEDNGPGIPEGVRTKIFEPFFTTKPTGAGAGLGLSMSHDIITKGHGGTLSVETTEGHGTTFIFRMPERYAGEERPQAEYGDGRVLL